jgi:hypothetical protein
MDVEERAPVKRHGCPRGLLAIQSMGTIVIHGTSEVKPGGATLSAVNEADADGLPAISPHRLPSEAQGRHSR